MTAPDVPTPTGPMRLHLFRPAAAGRYPGILLYSEIYQITGPIRRMAAFLAGQGYLVAAPEVYHEFEKLGAVLAYDAAGTDRGNELKFTKEVSAFDSDARTGLDFLAKHECCTARLGVMGICLGGHLAFLAAMNRDVLAAACFYATDIHDHQLDASGTGTMTSRILVSLRVAATAERAFCVFVHDIGAWWRPNGLFRFTTRSPGVVAFEPELGGRFTETFADSEVFEIGRITAWEPGVLLAFAWRQASFAPDQVTQVDVRFDPMGEETRVTVEHIGWDTIPQDHAARHRFPDAVFLRRHAEWWQLLLAAMAQSTTPFRPPVTTSQL